VVFHLLSLSASKNSTKSASKSPFRSSHITRTILVL
jgi:hypothetical protein